MEETAKGAVGRFWAGEVTPFRPIPCNRFPKQLPVPLSKNKRLWGRFWHHNSLGKLCLDREKERPKERETGG